MKKLISVAILSILFLLTPVSVKAEIIAGTSAFLVDNSFIKIDQTEQLRQENIKITIKTVLERYNSPMANVSESFVKACIKYKMDCYLLPSIAGVESTFGKHIWPNSYNPFGWDRGYMMFDSWSEGIDTVAKGLKNGYFNKGTVTVEDIGSIYSESPAWANKVNYFMGKFQEEDQKMILLSNQFTVQL